MEPEASTIRKVVFRSAVAYERKRIHAAAIYCSDGRMGELFDDFLQSGLKLPRYDRVALPGGPACLADHQQSHVQTQGVVDELKFLIEVHEIKRIVLLAHEGCAFYATRFNAFTAEVLVAANGTVYRYAIPAPSSAAATLILGFAAARRRRHG